MEKKVKESKQPEEVRTTFRGKVSKYGFLHFGKPLAKAWGLTKGTEQPITIELTTDGALIIRKP